MHVHLLCQRCYFCNSGHVIYYVYVSGCLIGLKDSVTAITFVALGTSLPDLFASKQSATQEKTADNSIGNVTGSNSVNVFLGLGLPWVIASIYWTAKVRIYAPVLYPHSIISLKQPLLDEANVVLLVVC